jgi:hypothetical protein
MTSQNQPLNQNLDFNNLNSGREDEQNLSSSSSSSSSRPSLLPYQALMRFKKAAALEDQAEFFCPATAKEKDRAAKLEALVLENNNDMKKMNKTYTQLIVERAQEIGLSMDFLSTKENSKYKNFTAKIQQQKPLKFNKLDKFAAKIESDVDIIGNAAIDTIKALESGQEHQVMFHLTNIVDDTRDARSEANLRRLIIRDAA